MANNHGGFHHKVPYPTLHLRQTQQPQFWHLYILWEPSVRYAEPVCSETQSRMPALWMTGCVREAKQTSDVEF